MSTLVIAEAGVNHNGDLELAKQLIDVAAEAGADWVKFQTFSADRLVTTEAKKAHYQAESTAADESQHAMLRGLELTRAMHETLIAHCKLRGIRFFSTAFDTESLDLLVDLGLESFKIPSGEITNLPYLRHVGRYGKSVILSTGMSTLGDIEAALDVLENAGTPRAKHHRLALQYRVSDPDGRCESASDDNHTGGFRSRRRLFRSHARNRDRDCGGRTGCNGD